MNRVTIDFERIGTDKDFYVTIQKQLALPDFFGANADALWDVLTADIALPVHISFVNMTLSQLDTFDDIIHVMEEVADELGDDFSFDYSLKQVVSL